MSKPAVIQMMQKMMKMMMLLADSCRGNCIREKEKAPGPPPIPKKPDEAGSATSAACVLRRPSSIEFWRAVGTPQVRSRGDACMSEPSI